MIETRVLEVSGRRINCRVLSVVHLERGPGFIAQVELLPQRWKKVDLVNGHFETVEAAFKRAEAFVAEQLS